MLLFEVKGLVPQAANITWLYFDSMVYFNPHFRHNGISFETLPCYKEPHSHPHCLQMEKVARLGWHHDVPTAEASWSFY